MNQEKGNVNKLTMLGMMTALVFVSNYLRITMPIAIGGRTSFTLRISIFLAGLSSSITAIFKTSPPVSHSFPNV